MKKILKYTFVCALALSVACSPKSAIKETRSNTPNVESFNDSVLFNTLYANAEMKYDFSKWEGRNFSQWQKNFRAELSEKMGLTKLNKQLAGYRPVVKMSPEIEYLDGFTRQRGTIWTEPEMPLPFVILMPTILGDNVPLVLALQGHSKNPELFAGIYANEADRKSGEEGERNIGIQAVMNGCIAIVPTTRGFGATMTKRDIAKGEMKSCKRYLKRDLLVGRTPIGDRVWDVMKILDWALEEFPIDMDAVIVTGNSGGGTTTLFSGAMDERIKYSLPGSYFCTFVASIGNITHCDCNYIPGILDLGEMGDVAGLTAPRVFRAINGVEDRIFPIAGTRTAYEDVKEIYTAAGVPDNCSLYEGPEGHRYYKAGIWPYLRSREVIK